LPLRGPGRLTALTLEGEPGIGKTRLLLEVAELAAAEGFTPLAATADEEIRGPFLLARGIFSSSLAAAEQEGNGAQEQLQRVLDAVSGRDDPTLESLSPDQKLLRVFDLAAVAIRSLATARPLAVLIDDLQWADEDSVRMLRYVVRTDADLPVFLGLATRRDELAVVNEAVTLIADMERMGMVRRLKLERFTQLETTEFVQQVLGGKVNLSSAATMHAQAEGVAFIVEELARSYREMGMIQEVDGAWTLARNAERLLPSAVRTLIQRRAARLPDETKQDLADAAILGRSFSLKDLHSIKLRLGADEETCSPTVLAESLAPAATAGLVVEHPAGSPADYSFTHDQVREYAAALLTAERRRAIHTALVDMLTAAGDPPPREPAPPRTPRTRRWRSRARRALLHLSRSGSARVPRGGGGASHSRPGSARRLGSAGSGLTAHVSRRSAGHAAPLRRPARGPRGAGGAG
jgi:hypothetical protein